MTDQQQILGTNNTRPEQKKMKIDNNYHAALLQSTKCIHGPNATGKKVGDSFLGLAYGEAAIR